MTIAVSPEHTVEDILSGASIEKKIDIFDKAINGWQLNIAKFLIDQENKDRGFAELMIVVSYFEQIELYYTGVTKDEKRRTHARVKKGFRRVFPNFQIQTSQQFNDESEAKQYGKEVTDDFFEKLY